VGTGIERISVDRSWIGAPAARGLGNPTVALSVAALALFTVGTVGYLAGGTPAALVVVIHAVAMYVSFTVLHESMHGVAHRSRPVNDVLGRLAGIPLTITLPMFRGVHYEHHSHTNDIERDPDLIVSWRPRWLLPLWCLGVMVEYRLKFFGHRLWRTRADLIEAVAMEVLLLAVAVVAVAGGWWRPLLVLWLGPAAVAVVFLAFAFDFLPHYPYDSRQRYLDTRAYPGSTLNALLLGQNYHLIHHLWTTIPWYRYQAVFGQIHRDLAARGCRIDGLSPTSVRKIAA
jgi:beta-carotene hydroxylase